MTLVDNQRSEAGRSGSELGPAKLEAFAHVSLPCRDLEEAVAFYVDVMGGELRVLDSIFGSVLLAGVNVGFGTNGVSFMRDSAEYPHVAFFVSADELLHARRWLAQCEIPMSNLWTRRGKEVLMFFRDPSGNVLELFCTHGFEGADTLPVGKAAGHGEAVDVNELRYTTWRRPVKKGSRIIVREP